MILLVCKPSGTFAILTLLFSTVLVPIARAERVGYQFTGQMTPPPAIPHVPVPDTYTLFKVKVPTNAPITGTFSYDTTSTESDGADNAQVFTQGIQGGLTFDVLGSNGTTLLHLVASQYTITANNDFLPKDTPSPIDSLKVDLIPPPAPVTANGASVTSVTSTLDVSFNWDPATFDAAALWSSLPTTPYTTVGLVGTSSLGAFNITSLKAISPPSGDYNVDGRVDANDYVEWQKAFGKADSAHAYADGNHNGVVDAADYVVWRSALSLGTAGSVSVPEPSPELLAILASFIIAGFQRRRA